MAEGINFILKVKDDGTATIKKFDGSLNHLDNTVKKTNTGFASLGKTATRLGALIGVTSAIGLGAQVIKTGANFQRSMSTVGGVMRATEEEMKKLTASAREMGATTEKSAVEAADALKFLGMAGFNAAEAMSALPEVINLSIAAGVDLGRSADIASNALTAMGLEVEELTRVNDVFVGAMTRSNVNMEQIAEAFKFAAPKAKAYGMDIETLTALIGKLGDAGVQGCYDINTEVLTEDGWKFWKEVSEKDKFATVNQKTEEIEYQKSTNLVAYKHKGKMYNVKNKHLDLVVTPNHNMFVSLFRTIDKEYKLVRADEIAGRPVRYMSSFNWKGKTLKHITLDGFEQNKGNWTKTIEPKKIDMKVFVEFLGYYLTEGCCDFRKGNYRIRITQKKERGRKKIETLLKKMPFHFRKEKDGFVIVNQQLYKYVVQFGNFATKNIPKDIKNLDKKLLRILYDACVVGDGSTNGELYTSSLQLRDDYEEICLKLGFGVSHSQTMKKGDKSFNGCATKDGWKVNVRTSQLRPTYDQSNYTRSDVKEKAPSYGKNIYEKWTDYNDMVYCAEVPNHVLIIRRNGKITACGNSMAGTQLAFAFGQVGKVFEKFGMNGEGKSFVDALELVAEKGLGADEVMELFGERGGRAVLILKDMIPEFKKLREEVKNSQGEAKTLAEAMNDTVVGAFNNLRSAITDVGIGVFTGQQKELQIGLEALAEVIRDNSDEIAILGDLMGTAMQFGAWAVKNLGSEVTVLTAMLEGDIEVWEALTHGIGDSIDMANKLKTTSTTISDLSEEASQLVLEIEDLEKVSDRLNKPWMKIFGPDTAKGIDNNNIALETKKERLEEINKILEVQSKFVPSIKGGERAEISKNVEGIDDLVKAPKRDKESLFDEKDLEGIKSYWDFMQDIGSKDADIATLEGYADTLESKKEMLIEAGIEEADIEQEIFEAKMEAQAGRDQIEFDAKKGLIDKARKYEEDSRKKQIKEDKKLDDLTLRHKKSLGTNLIAIAGADSKAVFYILKAQQVAGAITSAYEAYGLALAHPPGPPTTIPTAQFALGLGLANAGAIAAVSIKGAKAKGGDVIGGNSYLVGEQGAEVFTPNVTGSITPNNALGGSSVTIINEINISTLDATGMRETVREEIIPLLNEGIINNVNDFRDNIRGA